MALWRSTSWSEVRLAPKGLRSRQNLNEIAERHTLRRKKPTGFL
jgi:hypothetical protein